VRVSFAWVSDSIPEAGHVAWRTPNVDAPSGHAAA